MFRRVTTLLICTAVILSGCSADSDEETTSASTVVDDRAAFPEVAAASVDWLQQIPIEQGIFAVAADGTPEEAYDRTVETGFALATMNDEAGASELTTGLIRTESLNEFVGDGKKRQSVRNTARVITNVVASGQNPEELSGRRLVDELTALQNSSGRFLDLGGKDTSDTHSQAWAVMALSGADEAPRAAVNFLAAQQCKSGGYPQQLSDLPDGSCKTDLEATALTISALLSAGLDASSPEVNRAVQWLLDEASQSPEGAYWTSGKEKTPDVEGSVAATIALVDAYAQSGDAMRWLRTQVIKEGVNAGAIETAGKADQATTALGVLVFSGRGYRNLFI